MSDSGLRIPEMDPESSTDEAAMAYASAGWYVLPIDPTTKHAGSVLGKGWPMKSSRDPQQIFAWFAGSTDGIALHVGRSGAVVFDVDVPDDLPPLLADHLTASDPPFQSSNPDVIGKGHYLFAAPAGRDFSNGAGKLRGPWGEVRGRNGIICVFPTPHSKGGRYTWVETGPLPELPAELAALLPDATDADASATDAEAAAFLINHSTGTRPDLAEKLFEKINAQYGEGISRHQIFVDITAWAMREAWAGLYPAPGIADRLRRRFVSAMATCRNGSERVLDYGSASREFAGILSWAIAQARQSSVEEIRKAVDARLSPSPLVVTAGTRVTLTPASAYRPTRVRWGWADRMPIGELTLIPGREGIGKSLFLAWMAAQLTRGTLPGEFEGTPRSVLYVASEDSWSHTLTPRLLAAGADTDLVFRVGTEGEGKLSLPDDCVPLAAAALGVQACALMLDPIISLINDNLSVNQARELRQALEPLRLVAEGTGMMILALAHFNKATDTDVLSKIPGARAWAEVARAAFGLAQDDEDDGVFIGSQIKNNLGRLDLPHREYKIEETPIVTDEGAIAVARLVWTGVAERGVAEILGASKADRRGRDTSLLTKKIISIVGFHGHTMSVQEVHDRMPDAKRDTVQKALLRAAERGELSNPAYGHYGPAQTQKDNPS